MFPLCLFVLNIIKRVSYCKELLHQYGLHVQEVQAIPTWHLFKVAESGVKSGLSASRVPVPTHPLGCACVHSTVGTRWCPSLPQSRLWGHPLPLPFLHIPELLLWEGSSPNRLRAPVLSAPRPRVLEQFLPCDGFQYRARGRQETGQDNRPPSHQHFLEGRSVRTQDGKQLKRPWGGRTGRVPHRTAQQPDRIPHSTLHGAALLSDPWTD